MKKVLLLEPNPYHTEVVPGIAKYFEDLGYIVDIYLRKEVQDNRVFCRYKISGELRYYNFADIKSLLESDAIKAYDFLFLTSMEHSENGKIERFLTEIGVIPKTKYGILGIYHTNWLIDKFEDFESQGTKRIFCISDFQCIKYNILSIAPIFFINGQKKKPLAQIKNVLIIGNSADFSMLYSAYWKLEPNKRKYLKISYIGTYGNEPTGAKDWVINKCMTIYGMFDHKYKKIPDINCLGKVDFENMYKEIENTDYLLVLINPYDDGQKRYIECVTSGIRQLIFGFNKVAIISDLVAEKYDIEKGAYIGFDGNNLVDGLRCAIAMEPQKYHEMENSLRICSKKVYKKSLSNLDEVIRGLGAM